VSLLVLFLKERGWQNLRRKIFQKTRRPPHHKSHRAIEHVDRIRQIEFVARPCARDVHQSALFLDLVNADAHRAGKAPFRHVNYKYDAPLESLRRMDRAQCDVTLLGLDREDVADGIAGRFQRHVGQHRLETAITFRQVLKMFQVAFAFRITSAN